MLKVLMVYTSMTGNTEEMAEAIACMLEKNPNIELTKMDIFHSYPENFDYYDGLLIGSYTWGDGDVPDEMMDFYEELEDHDLTGKIGAVFGSGDSLYDDFCGALDHFTSKLAKCNILLPLNPLKVDMEPEKEDIDFCRKFAEEFIIQLINQLSINGN